ncbi:hypothetical protein ACMGD3_17750 [Lysinibacillus sphaericus]|uniref:hypothetical protein n=1 Tax=Lysinibacillus sphaericus TaxID=1421 RepID=UPI001C5E7622
MVDSVLMVILTILTLLLNVKNIIEIIALVTPYSKEIIFIILVNSIFTMDMTIAEREDERLMGAFLYGQKI